jgi:hypothetical protein
LKNGCAFFAGYESKFLGMYCRETDMRFLL